MPIFQVPAYTSIYNGDTSPSAGSLVVRDSGGNIQGNTITCSAVANTGVVNFGTASTTTSTGIGTNHSLICNPVSSTITVTLGAVSSVGNGRRHEVLLTTGTSTVNVIASDSATFAPGGTVSSLTSVGKKTYLTDGSNWFVS